MKVLLDHNLPRQLKAFLAAHDVFTAREMQWDALSKGELIKAAEVEDFKVMITGRPEPDLPAKRLEAHRFPHSSQGNRPQTSPRS